MVLATWFGPQGVLSPGDANLYSVQSLDEGTAALVHLNGVPPYRHKLPQLG
jgi:hypothetical protein